MCPTPAPTGKATCNPFLETTAVIFALGFTPCKVEQPLEGMELQEKEALKNKAYRKSL